MPPTVLKKTCPYCNKSFLTYEKDLNYCNKTCDVRDKYNKHFGLKREIKEKECLFCGESTSLMFCNEKCKSLYGKKKRLENNKSVFLKDKPKGKRLPYDVLNKIAEKKRVFEDSWWMYNTNRERI